MASGAEWGREEILRGIQISVHSRVAKLVGNWNRWTPTFQGKQGEEEIDLNIQTIARYFLYLFIFYFWMLISKAISKPSIYTG